MSERTLIGGSGPDDPHSERVEMAIKIITSGDIPEQPERLTRRKRHIVVAADQWEDDATVWFVRRGHSGEPADASIHLKHDGQEWRPRGGSGGAPGADLGQRLTLAELELHYSRHYHHAKREPIPFGFHTGASWSPSHATVRFQTAVEAATLTFTDRESRPIAGHGYCLVAYSPKRPPTITALDTSGNDLGSFTPVRNQHRGRGFRRFTFPLFRRSHGVYGANQRWRWKRR